MALAECRECGKQVSTRAMACPHCGANQPGEAKTAVALKAKTPWLVKMICYGFVGLVALSAFVQMLGGNKSKVPEKSPLAKLCEEHASNVVKFQGYWDKGNFPYAQDVMSEMRQLEKQIATYPQEARVNVCGAKYQVASTAGKTDQLPTKPEQAVQSKNLAPSAGCTAAPFEVLPMGKSFTLPELTSLMSQNCRTGAISIDRPVEVKWEEKIYLIGIAKSPNPNGIERFEITSIRGK